MKLDLFFEQIYNESLFGKREVRGYQIAVKHNNEWISVDAFGKLKASTQPKTYETKIMANEMCKNFKKRFPDKEFKVVEANDEFKD